MILATKTLAEITGLQRPSAVRRWLDCERIPYVVGADGMIPVTSPKGRELVA